MTEHPNATIYRQALEGFASGDETAADLIADDIVWHQIGAETLRGKQALLESMTQLEGLELDIDVHDVVANDDHVVGLVTATVDAGDGPFTYRTAEIAHIENGKVTERWAFSDDTQAIVDFFATLG